MTFSDLLETILLFVGYGLGLVLAMVGFLLLVKLAGILIDRLGLRK